MSFDTLASLCATILSKAWLWAYCAAVAERSSTALALAEDHANDVMSNSVAVVACGVASLAPSLWWADPGGAIAISIYIIMAWWDIARDHIEQIVGNRAAKESEIPNFKGSYLGRFPLVSADFWTSDHLSERSRSVDAFSVTRARGTLTLKRR